MAESNDDQTLEKIHEVDELDESQIKNILTSQCIKALSYLVHKLQKQSEQQKQVCNFTSDGNLKLKMEIKIAEQEVQSLKHALDTIIAANIELKKELLIAKERKISIIERVNNGIKKYNELWRVSKKRYESIPLIHNYIQTKEKNKTLQESILNLTNETQKLRNDIEIRRRELAALDRKYIIELANFMVRERPQMLQRIQEKNCKVEKLLNDIRNITKEYNTDSNETATSAPTGMEDIDDSWPDLTVLPKLQLHIHDDLDILTIKLNQLMKVDSQRAFKRESEKLALDLIPTKKMRSDETVKEVRVSSSTPKKSANDTVTNEYHRKSLMIHNILDSIKLELDSAETNNVVSNIKPSSSKDVDVIDSDVECDQEKVIDKTQKDIPVSGFLFTHGPQGIIDSLNISTSTDNSRSGFDDTDADYPHCTDSSLPSSPKADIESPNTNDNNQQELSQHVSNFMSGLRKEWLSYFDKISTEN